MKNAEKQKLFLTAQTPPLQTLALLAAFALIFAGCTQPELNIQFNASIQTPPQNSSNNTQPPQLQTSFLPDSITICIYGNPLDNAGLQYEEILKENLTLTEQNKSIKLSPKWLDSSSSAAEFEGCSILIAKADETGKYCGKIARQKIKQLVQNKRASLILAQDACTLSPEDPAVFGWDFEWKNFLPLKMDVPGNDAGTLGEIFIARGKFTVNDPYDPAIGDVKNFNFTNWNTTETVQSQDGKIIAFLRTNATVTTEVAVAGIVRKSPLLPMQGYIYYFAYEPTNTPAILRRVIELAAQRNLPVP